MKKADLYATPTNQHRLVIGTTANGYIAFATRGANAHPDYNHCQIQSPAIFASEATFVQTVSPTEISRVEALFENYIATKGIK